jgi:hypothetical protein
MWACVSFYPCFVTFYLIIVIFSCPISCLLFFFPLPLHFFLFVSIFFHTVLVLPFVFRYCPDFILLLFHVLIFFDSIFIFMFFVFHFFFAFRLNRFFVFSCWRSLITFAFYPLFSILFFIPSFSLPFPFMHVSRIWHCDSYPNMHTDTILMPVSGNCYFVTM